MKKIVCLLLALALSIAVFAGCGGNDNSSFRQSRPPTPLVEKTAVRRFLKAAWIFLQKPNWSCGRQALRPATCRESLGN